MESIYRLEGIRQVYGRREVLALDDVEIGSREIIGLAGHNGSGKSTLMRILAFLEYPAAGRVYFNGKLSSARDAEIRKRVTLLNQEPYLLKRSVRGNVGYGLKVRGDGRRTEKVDQALNMVGLDPEKFGRRAWYELSGGEAQRVALAARLILEPQVLLLDEPTSSLDRESAELIQKAAIKAREAWGATLVVVSHEMDLLKNLCDRTLTLADGRLVRDA